MIGEWIRKRCLWRIKKIVEKVGTRKKKKKRERGKQWRMHGKINKTDTLFHCQWHSRVIWSTYLCTVSRTIAVSEKWLNTESSPPQTSHCGGRPPRHWAGVIKALGADSWYNLPANLNGSDWEEEAEEQRGGRLRADERGPSVTACISYNKIIRM